MPIKAFFQKNKVLLVVFAILFIVVVIEGFLILKSGKKEMGRKPDDVVSKVEESRGSFDVEVASHGTSVLVPKYRHTGVFEKLTGNNFYAKEFNGEKLKAYNFSSKIHDISW